MILNHNSMEVKMKTPCVSVKKKKLIDIALRAIKSLWFHSKHLVITLINNYVFNTINIISFAYLIDNSLTRSFNYHNIDISRIKLRMLFNGWRSITDNSKKMILKNEIDCSFSSCFVRAIHEIRYLVATWNFT